jgi:hypothetical protein
MNTMRLSRSSVPWIETIAAFLLLLLEPSSAWANPIIPPVVVVWPAAWILFVPVVLIEAVFAMRVLRVRFGEGLRLSFWANLFSTVLGVPIGTCLNPIPFMLAGGENSGIAGDLVFSAALLLPLYILSVLAEAWVVRRLVDGSTRKKVWRWAWLANGVTYALISAGLLALILDHWLNRASIGS